MNRRTDFPVKAKGRVVGQIMICQRINDSQSGPTSTGRGWVEPHSYGSGSALLVPDSDRLIDLRQKNLAVTNFAGGGGLNDGIDRGVDEFVRNYQFNLDFWQEIHAVLATSIGF